MVHREQESMRENERERERESSVCVCEQMDRLVAMCGQRFP